ncbi:MAG TPA: DUF3471 domain-containing protein [Verrucomicrobiae bacterium]|nr:DUF3471 domain-containing protein [Verrucomicrobiae bacterium]
MKRSLLRCGLIVLLGITNLNAQSSNVVVATNVLETYVGQYELGPGFVLTIRREGNRITGQPTGQPRLRLIPESQTEFRVSTVDASLTFVKDKEGKVTQLVLHQNGDHEAQKISDKVPKDRIPVRVDPSKFDSLVGQYELAPDQVFTIRRDGDKLRAQLTGQPSFQVFPESETEFFYTVVDAQLTFVKDKDGKVTELVLHQNGDKTARKTSGDVPAVKGPDLSKIPVRDPKATPQQIDLSGKYTAPLTEQWHPDVTGLPAGENHLGKLPRGLQKLGGTEFDVRGLIQLTGTQAEFAGASFPESQSGIKIGAKCKRLSFLQGTGWQAEDGTIIGKYVLHYAGGTEATLNIAYGPDVRDWWANPSEPKTVGTASVAWTGSNAATDAVSASLRLYKRTYENPKPELTIETLDFISTREASAPFLVALTLED